MNNFLNKIIEDTPRAQRKLVQQVLAEATVDKSTIDTLANSIKIKGKNRTLLLQREDIYSRIGGGRINSNFRSTEKEIEDMFVRSNKVTTLLASIGDVLGSEIKSLNKDIDVVEKSIKNYAFLLADGLAYDYAFLEPFSDYSHFDKTSVIAPDRDHSVFTLDSFASVNTDDGSLVISDAYNKTYSVSSSVAFKNFSLDISESANQTGNIGDAAGGDKNSAWTVKFTTPAPLVAPLKDFTDLYNEEYSGALIAVDYDLSQPAPCDSISIDPVAGNDFDLVQIVVYYADEDSTTKSVLSQPQTLDNKKTYYFPVRPVKKIRCFYRQISYVRKYQETAATSEPLNRWYNDKNKNAAILSDKLKGLNAAIVAIQNGRWNKDARPNFSNDKYDNNAVKLPSTATIRMEKYGFGQDNISTLLLEAAAKNVNKQEGNIIDVDRAGVSITESEVYNYAEADARVAVPKHNKPTSVVKTTFKYEYNFGIKDIKIGLSTLKSTAVYISEKLPSPGDIGEIKLVSSEDNPTDISLDNTLLTSVEYSVSNVSKPEKESDWIPILPSGTTSVLSERMLFDEFGKSYFRFKASYNDNIVIYKNGNIIDITPFGKLLLDGQANIIGAQIDTQFYTSRDIFTCYYTPTVDANVVNFEASGFDIPPLVAMSDNDGPGEGFTSTSGQLSVSLKNYPFIDNAQAASSTYSPLYGMIGYSPISIKFEDGTIAYNLTNYTSPINQSALDPNSDAITFIHTKNVLMFNRAVSSKFRVFYQYLPANTRVRVVLRSNTDKFVTPKVDYYQIKSKTRFPNSSSDL